MKVIMLSILLLGCCAAFAQEKKTSKGHGTDKHTPANKDYDKTVSKESGKMQIRKSGNNTNGLADTTRTLTGPEQNTMNRAADFSASSSGSPSTPANNDGLLPDGTNTTQRASYNMAGSPIPSSRRLIEPAEKKEVAVEEPKRKTKKKR
ncbi:hypothetical protein [Pseudochryseolinea flava]|uniref:Uncharacterized protein n=1 Tax=Pseudochryseolinea flava TaxID=2059302 RepID=A0A364XY64_9BACT|nr:hypothetical protein [Pseudochryseolinea flava]RAV99251.1 hypothetical protein DQQ10_20365 [Pseudochryseolinea flava]